MSVLLCTACACTTLGGRALWQYELLERLGAHRVCMTFHLSSLYRLERAPRYVDREGVTRCIIQRSDEGAGGPGPFGLASAGSVGARSAPATRLLPER